MITKKDVPNTARRTPISRTARGAVLEAVHFRPSRPNSLTSSAPPMLSVSFIMAFIWALASIRFAGDIAQARPHAAGCQDEERQDQRR